MSSCPLWTYSGSAPGKRKGETIKISNYLIFTDFLIYFHLIFFPLQKHISQIHGFHLKFKQAKKHHGVLKPDDQFLIWYDQMVYMSVSTSRVWERPSFINPDIVMDFCGTDALGIPDNIQRWETVDQLLKTMNIPTKKSETK